MATEKDKILAEKEADRLIAKFDNIRLALVDSIMVCFEHQDTISKLEKDLKNQWIDIKKRLPEDDTFYLLHIERKPNEFYIIKAAYIGNHVWQEDDKNDTKWNTNTDYCPTHWMPIPKKPIN